MVTMITTGVIDYIERYSAATKIRPCHGVLGLQAVTGKKTQPA
jgi:hypothetical protein